MTGKAIVGKKVGMTQVWDEDNRVIPVTVLQVPPCRIVQIKTPDRDGYSALQVTQGSVAEKKLNQGSTAGLNTAYISFELSEELTSMRLDAMMTNIPTRKVFPENK